MTQVVTESTVDSEVLARVLEPRRLFVLERLDGTGPHPGPRPAVFEAADGPFERYRRAVEVQALGDGRHHVRQTVEYRLAIPFFGWLFSLPARRLLGRLVPPARLPWWSPPERVGARSSRVLAQLCVLSMVAGYLGTLLTQTVTFAAQEFGAGTRAQAGALAVVRADVVLTIVVVGLADRRGRRRTLLSSTVAGCALTATGALTPSLAGLAGSQVVARAFVTATGVLLGIMAAEEVPAGTRAYAVSLLAMAGALGAGLCVFLLPVAGLGLRAWRLLYAVVLLFVPMVLLAGRGLPESRRFRADHTEASMAGHGHRFWLLAVSAFLLNLFVAPAAQFQNEFLRRERGFSAGRISLFTLATGTPGAIGVIVGGRLADLRGRRIVGAVGVVGGVGATVLVYATRGWALWAWSVVGSILGAATVPALGVYGPELFPTSLRGRANGVITGLARAGGVIGLLAAGRLAGSLGGLSPTMARLAVGPAVLGLLVLVAYPETAHRELEELNPEDAPGGASRPPAGRAPPAPS